MYKCQGDTMFEFKNTESFDFHKRNLLLQKSLRHSESPIPIEEEYPLVLSSNQLTKSYCGYLGNEIVTHSNLISKFVINDSNCKNILGTVGLIGNLATDPNFRGKGLMRKNSFMENIARTNGDLAIYLWSDLESFYKKLGFIHAGTEFRYEIKPTDVGILKSNKNNISVLSGCDIKPHIAKNLLKIRKICLYFEKGSNEDFCTLLKIPDTHLIINSLNGQIQAYAIIGKGADFIGIVHEWGHRDFVS